MKNKLKESRFKLRMSQYKLAILSGVSQSRISLIENQLVEPTVFEMKQLSKALGKRINDLFNLEKAGNNSI